MIRSGVAATIRDEAIGVDDFFLDLFVIFGEVSYICKQIQELNTYFYEGSY